MGVESEKGKHGHVLKHREVVRAQGAQERRLGERKWRLRLGNSRRHRPWTSQHFAVAVVSGQLRSLHLHSWHRSAAVCRVGLTGKRAV